MTEGFIECTVLTAAASVSEEQSSQLVWLRSKKEEIGIQQCLQQENIKKCFAFLSRV